ncbi:Mariner Mos1 transposase [Araneus ventricosus]|uniref:Mariner Mos1 transposase n=1 Tax=Araneus ventricosus TaxID=182803 RepID=A0A4Y1ZSB8_ARAVE|nr:Mariner Mos1 transposase [Araneus ventricosus]GBL65746.1 Mariner Mos1 transposase [Araneus ventricosus]
MLTVFWDTKDVILIDFFTAGTINAACYCDTLTKLKSAILRKRPGLLSRGVLFLDDNARPDTARHTKEHIRRLGWERLDDTAYSPDLALSDFLPFPTSKSALLGRHYRNNVEVRKAKKNFLLSLGTDFYPDGFLKLISWYDKCINISVVNMWRNSKKFSLCYIIVCSCSVIKLLVKQHDKTYFRNVPCIKKPYSKVELTNALAG